MNMAYLLNIVLMLGLPALVYYLWICATRHDGALFLPTTIAAWQDLVPQIPAPTTTSVLLFAGWLLFQAILQAAAPGKVRQGTPLADGTRLTLWHTEFQAVPVRDSHVGGWTSTLEKLAAFCRGAA